MNMGKRLESKIKRLPPVRRRRVEQRAAELIAEEMSLRALRRAKRMTQADLAKALGVGQDGVSRLEERDDLLVSTLRNYVEAVGGKLRLVAVIPGLPPITLSGMRSDQRSGTQSRNRVTGARKRSIASKRGAAGKNVLET
jgi:transcriptional regulator with XRE-family HTH domain